jgi:hypothetical protein
MIKGPVRQEIVDAIESSWCDKTAGYHWENNPSKGQCAATALLVQDLYGGLLVRGALGNIPHYWNELPDGTVVDLTRQQFGEDADKVEFICYRDREYVLGRGIYDTEERYEILRDLVLDKLGEDVVV